MKRRYAFPELLLSVGSLACAPNASGPTVSPTSGSGTGPEQAECGAEGHMQPFMVSWDATDWSVFESQAAKEIVLVRYEGCSLTVLDECSLRSGGYLEPQWAPGKLERIDIETNRQLMELLPLAASKLGVRVSGGESFHMEYFVAGSRRAQLDAVSGSELVGKPGCEGATHFVQAFDLGAFALGSTKDIEVGAGGSAFGLQVEGSASRSQSAERKGGDLSACSVDDPAAARQCQAPIRLTLRELQ